MATKKLPKLDRDATGENIKRLMRLNKISKFELQMIFQFQSPRNIYSWCQGNTVPSAEHLVQLASIFNCTVDEILIREAEA